MSRLRAFFSSIFANPVFMMELRKRMRGRKPVFVLTLYLTALIGITTIALPDATRTGYVSNAAIGQKIFGILFSIQLVGIALIAPGLTATALPMEREKKTYPFLITTLLGPGEILFGKFLTAVAFVALLVVLALPVHAIVFILGGLAPEEVFFGNYLLFLVGSILASIGLAFGSEARKPLMAILITYILGGIFCGPPLAALGVGSFAFNRELSGFLSWGGSLAGVALTTLPVLAFIALFFSFAREQLAHYRERRWYFRASVLICGPLLPWWALFFERSAESKVVMMAGLIMLFFYHLILVFGTAIRLPDPLLRSQRFLPLLTEGFRPKRLAKDDSSSVLAFHAIAWFFHAVVVCIVALTVAHYFRSASEFDEALLYLLRIPSLAFAGAAHLFFWSVAGLTLALFLKPRTALNLGTIFLLVLIFATAWNFHDTDRTPPSRRRGGDAVFATLPTMTIFAGQAMEDDDDRAEHASEMLRLSGMIYLVLTFIMVIPGNFGWSRLRKGPLRKATEEDEFE